MYNAVTNASIFHTLTYVVPNDAFSDPEGDAITIEVEIIPNNIIGAYDSATRTFTSTPTNNSLAGVYTARFHASDFAHANATFSDIVFEFYENLRPVIDVVPTGAPSCQLAFKQYTYIVEKATHFTEPDGDVLNAWLRRDPELPSNALFETSNNSTHIVIDVFPTNYNVGNFTAIIYVGDGNNLGSYPTFSFEVCILENFAPALNVIPTISDPKVGADWNETIPKSWMTEPNGEVMTWTLVTSGSDDWLTCTEYPTYFYCTGFPYHNSIAGELNFTFSVSDSYLETSFTIELTVQENSKPNIVFGQSDKSLLAPTPFTRNTGQMFVDPEGDY